MIFFTNFTDKDFQHNWDKKPFKIKAGETKPVLFEGEDLQNLNIARTLARHMVAAWAERTGKSLISKDEWEEQINRAIHMGEYDLNPSNITVKKEETVAEKVKETKQAPQADDKDELIAKLKEMGIKADKRMKIETLQEKFEEVSGDEESFEGLEE